MKETVFHINKGENSWNNSLKHIWQTWHIAFDEDIFPKLPGHKAICADKDEEYLIIVLEKKKIAYSFQLHVLFYPFLHNEQIQQQWS